MGKIHEAKSDYEKSVDFHIPAAREKADAATLKKHPEYGKRIVYGPIQTGISYAGMDPEEKAKYDLVADYWDKVYFREMNNLCAKAGARYDRKH